MVRVINTYKVEILVFLFVTFNALLCVSLGIGVPVNNTTVVLCQAFLFFFLCFELIKVVSFEAIDIVLIFSLFCMIVLSLLVHEDMKIKDVFSVLILPLSILYFRSVAVRFWLLIRIIFWLATFILFFEVFLPEFLVQFFPVGEYFLNTRDWVASQDAAAESIFYIGAVRPGGYYFIPDVHRVGSIFLEPLTYSYFSLIMIISARYYENVRFKKYVYVLISMIAIILTDSRVAIFLGLLFCFLPLINFRFYFSVFFYVLFAFFIMYFAWQYTDGSNSELPLRLSYTFNTLFESSIASLLGLAPLGGKVNDSGYLLYITILGVPIFLVLLIWMDSISFRAWKYGVGAGYIPFYILLFVSLFFGGAILSAKIIVLLSAFVSSLKLNCTAVACKNL
jgi:putative polymerase